MSTDEPVIPPPRPIAAVGVVCFNDAGDVLLIQRGTKPRLGEWSIPGGKVEWGETTISAALRELREETSVEAEIIGLIDVVDGVFTSRTTGEVTRHYVLIDYVATYKGGIPTPGDDAASAEFVPVTALGAYGLWDKTLEIIESARIKLKSKQSK
jgi:8-oxo-dGTP diphosphatase